MLLGEPGTGFTVAIHKIYCSRGVQALLIAYLPPDPQQIQSKPDETWTTSVYTIRVLFLFLMPTSVWAILLHPH